MFIVYVWRHVAFNINTTSLAGPVVEAIYKFSTLGTCLQYTHNSPWERELFSRSTNAASKGMPLWLLDEQMDCSCLRWYWKFARTTGACEEVQPNILQSQLILWFNSTWHQSFDC